MRGSSTLSTPFFSGVVVAALLLAGCASDPGWDVPPHETDRFEPVSTGHLDCSEPSHSDSACWSEEKQKAIERYQTAQKAGN